MLIWLYDLPNSCIVLLFGMIGATLAVGVPLLREKLLRIHVPPEQCDTTRNAFTVVIGFTGLVLAFSLVQAQINLRNLEAQVGTEAHNLAQMDRFLVRFGDPENGVLRGSLRDYADSIVKDEWPQLRKGNPSERTTAMFRPFSRGIFAIDPMPGRQSLIYTEMLKKADELAADRKARLVAASRLKLPSIFWEIIIFLLLTLLVLASFSESKLSLTRVVALGGEGFGLALLVAFVFICDQPFKGHTSVSPDPIIKVIAEMQSRTS